MERVNPTLAAHGALLAKTAEAAAALNESAGVACAYRAHQWEALARAVDPAIYGVVLSNGSRYATITPDAASGTSRYSCFDARGPFSHGVYATPEAALIACFDMGYRVVAEPGALDALARQWRQED